MLVVFFLKQINDDRSQVTGFSKQVHVEETLPSTFCLTSWPRTAQRNKSRRMMLYIYDTCIKHAKQDTAESLRLGQNAAGQAKFNFDSVTVSLILKQHIHVSSKCYPSFLQLFSTNVHLLLKLLSINFPYHILPDLVFPSNPIFPTSNHSPSPSPPNL